MNTQPLVAKQFSDSLYTLKGISKKTIEEHLKLYQGYVNKYNEINQKLDTLSDEDYAKANQVFSSLRELKVELSFAWGGIINHELYFSILGDDKGTTSRRAPDGALLKQIEKDFRSFEHYKKDMKASGIAARGWVWTGWNTKEKRLFNYLGDSQNTYLTWDVIPIVALDTYEHAYFIDYGVNRSGYIDAFFENVNWNWVEKLFYQSK
jgi:superoxide dismutase, Fe-Mn family